MISLFETKARGVFLWLRYAYDSMLFNLTPFTDPFTVDTVCVYYDVITYGPVKFDIRFIFSFIILLVNHFYKATFILTYLRWNP